MPITIINLRIVHLSFFIPLLLLLLVTALSSFTQTNLGKMEWTVLFKDDFEDCETHPVGQKKPNAWGLYDMHGNVVERCSDWYSFYYYSESVINDPKGPSEGEKHVARGGGFLNNPGECRSAYRFGVVGKPLGPDYKWLQGGLRLVREE